MKETDDRPVEEQSLAMTPGLTYMLMVRQRRGAQLITTGNLEHLLSENPSLIRQMLSAVYLEPQLMELGRGPNPNPKYEDIHSDYQGIVESLSDADMDAVISTYPAFEQMVKAQLEFLRSQFEGEQIKTIEVVLMFLIEDGAKNLTSINDYLNIKASHLVYQKLAKEVFEKGKNLALSAKEEQDFINIGQALLKNTSLFEVRLQEDKPVTDHANRERHFDGLIAEAKFLQRTIAVLQNPSQNESRMVGMQIDVLRESLRLVKDRLRLQFPDRTLEVNKLLGVDADEVLGEKLRRWTRHPGEPEFSTAESTGFSHQNE